MAGVGPFKKEAGIGPLKNITVSRVDVPLTASMTSFPLRISGETSQIDVIVPWKMTSRRCLHFVSPLLSVLLHSPLSSFYFLFSVFCFLFSVFYFLFSIFCFLFSVFCVPTRTKEKLINIFFHPFSYRKLLGPVSQQTIFAILGLVLFIFFAQTNSFSKHTVQIYCNRINITADL